MSVHMRADGDVVILSNFGRLMNDPRHFDASRDVKTWLDDGYRHFVLELRAVSEMGASGLGLLMTITRLIRQHGGEVVLARPSRSMQAILTEMQLEEFWDSFPSVEDAKASFGDGSDESKK